MSCAVHAHVHINRRRDAACRVADATVRALMCLDFRSRSHLPAADVPRPSEQSVVPGRCRAAVCIVKSAKAGEHGQEHGLQRREDNGEALPRAARKNAAKIRALARSKMAAPKTPARGSTLAQDGSRCDVAKVVTKSCGRRLRELVCRIRVMVRLPSVRFSAL